MNFNVFKKNGQPLPIVHYGSPLLREKSREIETLTDEMREFIDRMFASMEKNDGIGLAAPQVGENIRLIVLALPELDSPEEAMFASPGERQLLGRMPLALVNPEVVPTTAEADIMQEGCLSIPGIYADVVRPKSVRLKAQTPGGEGVDVECSGLLARCLLHEVDHLEGILFVDRAEKESLAEVADELAELEKNTQKELQGKTPKQRFSA